MTHTDLEGEKVIIHWQTRDEESIRLIRERFGIPRYTTVNGQTPAILKPEDRDMFEETAKRGYFNYRRVDWTFNGATYSW